jgi:hypothetical protein
MRHKKQWIFSLTLMLLLIFVISGVGCAKRVVIGSPYERYDHNRTRQIVVLMSEANAKTKEALVDEVYIPSGSEYFSKAYYQNTREEVDGLPAANVVPIFTGVSLPLSSAPAKNGRSDKEDLLDYLASGPLAQAGVEPPATMGDAATTEIAYKPILELLESREQLSAEKKLLLKKLSASSISPADDVMDSRYRLRSFAEVLGFRHEQFWFILYKLPEKSHYSRLVVVPVKAKGQDFPGKRP